MPKIKTSRGAAKRFRRTAKGKFKRSRAYAGHLLSKKKRKRKRKLRRSTLVNKVDEKKIRALIPR